MRFKSLITLVLTICLAVLTSNAMAKGKKSGKSDKSEKSAKHSQKSDKSAKSRKSGKRGNGYGHCKSDKSGKGHGKKRGRGHDRDCDDDNEEPPVLVCLADIEESIRRDDIYDAELGVTIPGNAVSITYAGQVCALGDEVYPDVQIVNDNGSISLCSLGNFGSTTSISARQEDDSNFWYTMETYMACEVGR